MLLIRSIEIVEERWLCTELFLEDVDLLVL